MDDEKLKALRAAAEKATPGWRRVGHVEDFHVFIECSDAWAPELGRVLLRMNTNFPYVDDAAYIAQVDPTTILALLDSHAKALGRAESAELGCEIAYRREPTQAEGDAHEHGAPAHRTGECFVPMGGWTGRRCRVCRLWTWGGPTACARCAEADP